MPSAAPGSPPPTTTPNAKDAAKKRLQAAEGKLRRFQNAIAAGVDPTAMVEAINEAQASEAAQAELENSATSRTTDRNAAEVYAIIDSLSDVKEVTKLGDPAKLQELYQALDVQMLYNAEGRTVDATIRPVGRDKERVRGRSCSLTTRRVLRSDT